MHIRILGSAAGGRFPQWNCGCGNCVGLRAGTFAGKARTQAQLALSSNGAMWFLAGASPDLPSQIESSPVLHPRALRDSPIAGAALGSADLDHIAGLLLLRELQPLHVYAANAVLRILREENSMFGMLNRVDRQAVWSEMRSGAPFPLTSAEGKDSGLQCEAHYLSGRYPKYVKGDVANSSSNEATAALFFAAGEKRVAYVPAVGGLTDQLLEKLDRVDLLLFDGTFFRDDELQRVLGGGETAHQMGHIPVEESLRLLKNLRVGRRMFIHINNTNPILNDQSVERRAVKDAGWEVAEDNWQAEL